ncbi:hypothetical protein QF020_002301 [Pseudomonas frederiksbergensis]|uniref:hypothetical protein n=1 Tax=Pseudomonas frederiksbergensis TaxID=104087 RepID=UPI003D2302AD
MREQAASVIAQIGTSLLASHKVLSLVRHTPFHTPLGSQDLREAVYLGYLPWSSRLPDHVFEHSFQRLTSHPTGKEKPSLLLATLQAMADEFLKFQHGKLYVRQQKFGAWQQSVVSRISGLPLQAAAHLLALPRDGLLDQRATHWSRGEQPNWAERHLPIVSPYDPVVEDYLAREGLHETHLHLNGSTHAENCWLRALRTPKQETRDFGIKWHNRSRTDAASIRELAHSINPELSPVELHSQLVVASRLRLWLIAAATNTLSANVCLPYDYSELADEENQQELAPAPGERHLELSAQSCADDELSWMQQLLQKLTIEPSVIIERMFHAYLLLQNQYYRLLVQSEEQFGFDQFQKLTYTELREPAEADYLPRFWAMHGRQTGASRTTYLEGRFAPKSTLRKNHQLLKAILGGYWHYLQSHSPHDLNSKPAPHNLGDMLAQLETIFLNKSPLDRSHHRLALVVHFIKKPWAPGKKAGPNRFYAQRAELEHSTNVLLETLKRWPRLRTWVRGIDAASNELHAPPEVFASCYRACQHAGLTHRSYHVGEDFAHLLSGLRAMYDALELLDLRDGDRIGHGTAMGIAPRLWLERMPGQLVVKKGEWMLDLLAAWRLLRTLPEATAAASRVADDLAKCAGEVFRRDISCAELEAAMGLRHLNVRYLQAAFETDWSVDITPLNDIWQAEALRIRAAKHSNPHHLNLLWEWLSDENLCQRSESLESVDAAYFDEITYLQLQQALMREVAHRNVVVETLPSSNVRISQYHNFSEHHALRWMRVPGFVEKGDPEIMVSLGSDDPGIFAGDLNGEFYQLYGALRNQGISDQAALAHLAPVNERGRAYRFHDPFLG